MLEILVSITNEEFQRYVAVQYSGVTNMFNVLLVKDLAKLSTQQCYEIMENYDKLKAKYGIEEGQRKAGAIGIVNLNSDSSDEDAENEIDWDEE